MEKLLPGYFFEGEGKGNSFWGYFFGGEVKGIPF